MRVVGRSLTKLTGIGEIDLRADGPSVKSNLAGLRLGAGGGRTGICDGRSETVGPGSLRFSIAATA